MKIMVKERIVNYLPKAIQEVSNLYMKESYDNVVDTIRGADPSELASSLSDALLSYFGRDDWMELETYIYEKLVYGKDAKKNSDMFKDLLIANVNFVEIFK